MKLALFLAAGLLVLPPVAEAQIQLGFDSGVRIERVGGLTETTFEIPSNWLRIGFPVETFTIESLISLFAQRSSGQTVSVISFLPGIVYDYRANLYVRGEVGLLLISASGSSVSQFGYGVAVGNKRQIGPGPLYLRFELGIDQWRENNRGTPSLNDDLQKRSEFRALVGISVVVG